MSFPSTIDLRFSILLLSPHYSSLSPKEVLAYRSMYLILAPVKQPQHARFAIEPFERKFLSDAIASMNLNRRVGGFESHFRRPFLGQRGRSEKRYLVVRSPCGFES